MDIDVNNLPKEVSAKVFLMMDDSGWLVSNIYAKSDLYTTIGEAEVTFKIKKKDKIKGEIVDRLKAESQRVRADAEVKCKLIDDKINSLLAIENKGDSNE